MCVCVRADVVKLFPSDGPTPQLVGISKCMLALGEWCLFVPLENMVGGTFSAIPSL